MDHRRAAAAPARRVAAGFMKVGSLFSGIGGFDLGLEHAGFTIEWQVEIDEYARRVLAKHWPNVTRYEDIRAIDWRTVTPVDVLCGGFPCQDLSIAGRKAGLKEGTRSGLWFEYAKAIRILRPKYILVENVSGLLVNHAMGRVLGDLAECGYDAEWSSIRASDFGFPHERKRIFLAAYPTGSRPLRLQATLENLEKGQPEGRWLRESSVKSLFASMGYCPLSYDWRANDEFPDWMDRLKGLGNAVVPKIVEVLGRMILKAERRHP